MSAELLLELSRYAGNVGRELREADHAYQRAAGWQQWAEQSERAGPRLKVVIPLTSGFTLLVAAAFPLSQALGLRPDQVGAVLTPFLGLPAFFLMGYVLWSYSGGGKRAQRATAGNVAVACPNCGARAELVAGAASQVCAYCRAALVASPQVIEQGIDAAELAHRRARLEEFRQERLGIVGLARHDMTSYVPFIVGGSLLLPAGGGALAFTVSMLNGEEPYDPSIFLLWAIVLLIAGGLAAVLLFRRSRKARYERALLDLGRQFPLSPLGDGLALADWLNRHWPEKYETTALTHGHALVAASIDAGGYPALLNADFSGGEHRKSRLHLLVAAHQPAAHVPHHEARAFANRALARCRELGFQVTRNEAGFFAMAEPDTVRIVQKNPEALHEVAPVLGALVTAARALGAVR